MIRSARFYLYVVIINLLFITSNNKHHSLKLYVTDKFVSALFLEVHHEREVLLLRLRKWIMALTDEELKELKNKAFKAKELLQWRDRIADVCSRTSMLKFSISMSRQIRPDRKIFSSKLISETDEINKRLIEAADLLSNASVILTEISDRDFSNIEHEAANVLAECYKKMDESNE